MAEATFVQDGFSIDYTPTADTPAGTVVIQGDLVGITKLFIAANTLGALTVGAGVFDIAKAGAATFTVGAIVYWDDTLNTVSATATGNKRLGIVIRAVAAADTTARVRVGL
jgi:predicted RecA/RadA family phage recombinase